MSLPIELSLPPMPVLREEHHAQILVAEDPYINTFLRAVLQRRGHKVMIGEPYQCGDLMRDGEVKADVVITNTPQAFLDFADSLPILYIAASPDPDLASHFHSCRVLGKPFRNEDLLNAVEELSNLVVR